MDKNYKLLLVIVATTVVMVTIVIVDYFRKSCKGEYKCPDIPSSECNDSPTGKCLLKCDQASDECYKKCNGSDLCIQQCYQQKSQCYISCLGDTKDFCQASCGCDA